MDALGQAGERRFRGLSGVFPDPEPFLNLDEAGIRARRRKAKRGGGRGTEPSVAAGDGGGASDEVRRPSKPTAARNERRVALRETSRRDDDRTTSNDPRRNLRRPPSDATVPPAEKRVSEDGQTKAAAGASKPSKGPERKARVTEGTADPEARAAREGPSGAASASARTDPSARKPAHKPAATFLAGFLRTDFVGGRSDGDEWLRGRGGVA